MTREGRGGNMVVIGGGGGEMGWCISVMMCGEFGGEESGNWK